MIHKERIPLHGGIIDIPYGSDIIKAAMQNGEIFIWYSFDSAETEKGKAEFMIVGTGWDTDTSSYIYVDSVFVDVWVWHIFVRDVT